MILISSHTSQNCETISFILRVYLFNFRTENRVLGKDTGSSGGIIFEFSPVGVAQWMIIAEVNPFRIWSWKVKQKSHPITHQDWNPGI